MIVVWCGWLVPGRQQADLLQFSFPKRDVAAVTHSAHRHKPGRPHRPKYTEEEFMRSRFQFAMDAAEVDAYSRDPDVRPWGAFENSGGTLGGGVSVAGGGAGREERCHFVTCACRCASCDCARDVWVGRLPHGDVGGAPRPRPVPRVTPVPCSRVGLPLSVVRNVACGVW